MKKLVVALVVVILVTVAVIGYLALSPPQGFKSDSLVAPEVDFLHWDTGEAPQPSTSVRQATDWGIIGTTAEDSIYSGFGGVVWISASNSGPRNLYVYGLGLTWTGTSASYSKEAGVLVQPGEVKEIGLLPFGAPVESGSRMYEISLDVAVQHLTTGAWFDYGTVRTTADVYEVMDPVTERSWDTQRNPKGYYQDVNSRISTEAVGTVTDQIQSEHQGDYNILQVCEAYEWVRRNVEYMLDNGDYWQSAEETMSLRTGDCEDNSILLASIIKDLGGYARVNIIEAHAFATVFVGHNSSDLAQLEEAIESYYWVPSGSLRINYLIDSMGYWLMVDTLGVTYIGGLPAQTSYALTGGGQGTWTFTSSEFLVTVDVTGQAYNFLGLF